MSRPIRFIVAFICFTLPLALQLGAQSIQVYSGLRPTSFTDGNIFKFTYVSTDMNERLRVEATLMRNGRAVVKQSGYGESDAGTIIGPVSEIVSTLTYDPHITEEMIFFGLIPEGNYELIVTVHTVDGPMVKSTSFSHTASPNPLNIRLLSPANKAVIPFKNPILTWSSSTPPLSIDGLSYDIEVAQKGPSERTTMFTGMGQQKLLRKTDMEENVLLYPADAQELNVDEVYTWNVVLKSGPYVMARSQVWSFTLEDKAELNDLPISASYIDISKIGDSPLFYFMESMKLKYEPKQVSERVGLKIFNENGKEVKLKSNFIDFSRSKQQVIHSFVNEPRIKHLKSYTVELSPESSAQVVRFKMIYVNPIFMNL